MTAQLPRDDALMWMSQHQSAHQRLNMPFWEMQAQHLYVKDVHYLVKGTVAVIIDESTGRAAAQARWIEGIHQVDEPLLESHKMAADAFVNASLSRSGPACSHGQNCSACACGSWSRVALCKPGHLLHDILQQAALLWTRRAALHPDM